MLKPLVKFNAYHMKKARMKHSCIDNNCNSFWGSKSQVASLFTCLIFDTHVCWSGRIVHFETNLCGWCDNRLLVMHGRTGITTRSVNAQ